MRVANHPLDKAAVDAANKESAQKYSPPPAPGDPDYSAFRASWMDSYVAAGGTCRQEVKGERKARIQQDRAAVKHRQGNRGAVITCPQQKDAKPATLSAPPAPTKKADCPCNLTAMTVCCSHGRNAKNDLLMVVPTAGTADAIGIRPSASGDCATLTVRADGKDGFPKAGSDVSSFTARGALAANGRIFSLWCAAPVSTFVSAEACGVALHTIKVDAYPSNKLRSRSTSLNCAKSTKASSRGFPYIRGNRGFPSEISTRPGTRLGS